MENAVQKVVGAAGAGFAEGIAKSLVLIVLVGVVISAGSVLFGFLFIFFARSAYRKNNPKTFLTFGILASLSLAIFGGFLAMIVTQSPPFGLIFTAPVILIAGIWHYIKSYRKMGSGIEV